MQIYSILRTVFIFSLSLPIITILSYGILLLYYSKEEKKKHNEEITTFPNISVLIPTHNEERIIEKRIKSIYDTNYPLEKIDVIFIDDSSDSTADIIQKYVNEHENFQLIRFNERKGYSIAIQTGIAASKTDIIVLNEAGSFPRPDALSKLVANFENHEIGAVTAKSEILNTDEKVGQIESLYLKIANFIRKSESNMDSTFYIKGEATAYRRNLVTDIKAVENVGSIDTSMAFWIRKKGYKVVYDPEVIFDEYAPTEDSGYIKQKTIRAANWMRNLLVFKEMILNIKYGKFGIFTLPFNVLVLFIFPILPFIALTSYIIGLIVDSSFFFNFIYPLVGILLILLIFSKNLVILLFEIEISLLKAIYQIFFSQVGHDKIERVESTRRIS